MWPLVEHMYRVIECTYIFYTRHHPFEFRMWHFNVTLMLMLNAFISILIEYRNYQPSNHTLSQAREALAHTHRAHRIDRSAFYFSANKRLNGDSARRANILDSHTCDHRRESCCARTMLNRTYIIIAWVIGVNGRDALPWQSTERDANRRCRLWVRVTASKKK